MQNLYGSAEAVYTVSPVTGEETEPTTMPFGDVGPVPIDFESEASWLEYQEVLNDMPSVFGLAFASGAREVTVRLFLVEDVQDVEDAANGH